MRPAEWTLADLATEWQLPLELVSAARYIVGGFPARRTAAGVPVFDRAMVSRMHRLLIEKDAAVLFEQRDRRAEWLAFLQREIPSAGEFSVQPLPPEELTDEILG